MRKLYSNSLSIPLFLRWLIQLSVSPRFYASPWISIYICLPGSMPVHGFHSTYVSPVLCQSMDFNLHMSPRLYASPWISIYICLPDFLDRAQPLTLKLLKQDYVVPRFKSSLQKFYGCRHELGDRSAIFISQKEIDLFHST